MKWPASRLSEEARVCPRPPRLVASRDGGEPAGGWEMVVDQIENEGGGGEIPQNLILLVFIRIICTLAS